MIVLLNRIVEMPYYYFKFCREGND